MEHIEQSTLADDYLFSLMSQLPLIDSKGQNSEEYLAQKTREIKWYLEIRKLLEDSDSDEQFEVERIKNPDLYNKFDSAFGFTGAQNPKLSLEELKILVKKIEDLATAE